MCVFLPGSVGGQIRKGNCSQFMVCLIVVVFVMHTQSFSYGLGIAR